MTKEEKVVDRAEEEEKKMDENLLQKIRKNPILLNLIILLILGAAIFGAFYWQDQQSKIYIEKAEISAPIIVLGPKVADQIDKIYVQEGDYVSRGQNLAKVGNEIIEAKTAGIITWVKNAPGQIGNSQEGVVKMFDPKSLRLVGRIQEDKGLSEIRADQKVTFTVDAFNDKEYKGTVESVAPISRQSSVAFSISDKREEKEFEVNVVFDAEAYKEIKNSMSAKMWVYK